MIIFLLAATEKDASKISDLGPYFFMGFVAAVLAGVGLFRWNHERLRKKSIERELMNTMSRHELRRLEKEKAKAKGKR